MRISFLKLGLVTIALLLFSALPALANCGKCGMKEKGEQQMMQMQAQCKCADCSKKENCDCGCGMHKGQMADKCKCKDCSKMKDCDCGCRKGMEQHQHGKLKCDNCGKGEQHRHHGKMDDSKAEELFVPDKK